MKKIIWIVMMVVVVHVSMAEDAAKTARRIFETAGVKGGLVVHLGCGDGALTVALRPNDGYVVHGIMPTRPP